MRSRGFTLVELAIVLVVLGLVASGIVGGKALIHQAELQSIVRDVNNIKTSIKAFRLQYQAFPGDFARASDYWGVWAADDATGIADGNGNGHWEEWICYEGIFAWAQMQKAGIITGHYSSTSHTGVRFGEQAYPSRIANTGYNLCWHHPFSNVAGDAFNFITYGSLWEDDYLYGGALIAEDAWNIDSKMDDGMAGEGQIYGVRGWDYSEGCSDGEWGDKPTTYLLDDTTNKCALMIKVGGYSLH